MGSPDLYCQEDGLAWEDDDEKAPPLLLKEADENREIQALLEKEEKQRDLIVTRDKMDLESPDFYPATVRRGTVDWILSVNAHFGFSTLTSVLAVNYFDRFIISSPHFDRDKPWLVQLTAATCVSLAAKVEETHVPLLENLQVGAAKFLFRAKTIQRMEILVLSTLQWRMNPVNSVAFIHRIVRRLGLKKHVHREFLRRCERLILAVLVDVRYVHYLPSTVAAAATIRVIELIEPSNATEYKNRLMCMLKIDKKEVNECYCQLIMKASETVVITVEQKRKICCLSDSPIGDKSNNSGASGFGSSEPAAKKRRVREQRMPLQSLNRVFVTSPPWL